MDSVSQAVLGASVAAIIAPAGQRRRALLIGAALGTVPDLDVLIDYGDAVKNFTYHRGFSHSLFVLTPLSFLIWAAIYRFWSPAREAPYRWLAAIGLALITHPLLDAHTAYGTQLFWPLNVEPTTWATLFIIDPLYTLPLLIGVLLAAFWPDRTWSVSALRTGVFLSTLYVGWSWSAQAIVERNARDTLAKLGQQNYTLFITPTPLNTLLWRVVVRTEDGILEGYDSLMLDEGPITFEQVPSSIDVLHETRQLWAVARLRWFASDFVKASIEDGKLTISDLRMGSEPNFVFSFVVADRENQQWHAVPTVHIPIAIADRGLAATWQRIWQD